VHIRCKWGSPHTTTVSKRGTERRREGSFRGSLRQTFSELAAERFPVSLLELAPRTRSSRLEKEGFEVLLGVSLLILPDQVANVLAHTAVASGLDSGIDEGPPTLKLRGSRNVRAAPPTNGGRRPPVDAVFGLPGVTADVATKLTFNRPCAHGSRASLRSHDDDLDA
jgi:hypothetical protein